MRIRENEGKLSILGEQETELRNEMGILILREDE